MRKPKPILAFGLFFIFLIAGVSFGQQKVKDLKFHAMQDYSWMRLAEIVAHRAVELRDGKLYNGSSS